MNLPKRIWQPRCAKLGIDWENSHGCCIILLQKSGVFVVSLVPVESIFAEDLTEAFPVVILIPVAHGGLLLGLFRYDWFVVVVRDVGVSCERYFKWSISANGGGCMWRLGGMQTPVHERSSFGQQKIRNFPSSSITDRDFFHGL